MSKKDYQAIARALHVELIDAQENTPQDGPQTVRNVVSGIANVLAADNPAFDRARFLEACETAHATAVSVPEGTPHRRGHGRGQVSAPCPTCGATEPYPQHIRGSLDCLDRAGLACRECGEQADDGEGWDGLCGNCADRAAR